MSSKALLFILILSLNCGFSQPQVHSNTQSLKDKVTALMETGIENKAFPGAQVLIFKKDSLLLNESFGYHTYDKQTQVTNEHLYDLASLTKVLASTLALMKLYELYDLELDEPASNWIPLLKRSNKRNSSFKAILSHSAGWIPYITHQNKVFKKKGGFKRNTLSSYQSKRFPKSVSDSLYVHKRYEQKIKKRIKKTPLINPGEMVYSGLFFFLVPQLVRDLSGLSFEEFLEVHFYRPMELERIGFLPTRKFPKSVLVPTEQDSLFRKKLVHGWVHDEAAALMGGISGNAGLFANATSIAPLLQMLLNKGNYKNRNYLNPQTVELFTKRTYPKSENRRGLGFDKPTLELEAPDRYPSTGVSKETYGHTGFTGTMTWVDPKNELIVILLTNRVYPTRENRGLYDGDIRPKLIQYALEE